MAKDGCLQILVRVLALFIVASKYFAAIETQIFTAKIATAFATGIALVEDGTILVTDNKAWETMSLKHLKLILVPRAEKRAQGNPSVQLYNAMQSYHSESPIFAISMSSTLTLPLFPAFYFSSLPDTLFPSILLDSLVFQNSNTLFLIKKIHPQNSKSPSQQLSATVWWGNGLGDPLKRGYTL